MGNGVPQGPEFSWSHSRERLLGECARAYYWRYYGSHGGWSARASAGARLSWRLKHLITLHSVFGMAVHALARGAAVAVLEGRPRLAVPEMAEQVRAVLRAACLSTDRGAFARDPKVRPMLHSVYYGGRYDRGEADAVAAKVDACVRHLHESAIWAGLEALPSGAVVLTEAGDWVEWEGVRVYAKPDLVVLREDGSCEIVDWKTGRRREEEGAREQLAGYAWFVQRKLGITFSEGRWTARAVYLQGGEEERYDLTRLDLIRAEHRIRESVELMRGYLADPETNAPLPREAFPLVHPAFRFRCPRCPFFELCAPEMRMVPESASARVGAPGPRCPASAPETD